MESEQSLRPLLQPGRIGPLELKNRMVMAPVQCGWPTSDGFVTDRFIEHLVARARGGVALIIVETAFVDDTYHSGLRRLRVDSDQYVPGLARLADAIHSAGARAVMQITSGGAVAQSRRLYGVQPVGPSAFELPSGDSTRELSHAEIEEFVALYGAAAGRVRAAGFDGVEIHGAHRYLIGTFLSPSMNRRTDEYGGSTQGRARFLVEVIHAARKALGPGLAVWPRLNGEEIGLQTGLRTDGAIETAALAVAAGADAIHVSAFAYGVNDMWGASPRRPGMLLPLAGHVKKAVSVPVIAVGRLDPLVAGAALANGQADFVAFGRQLNADPDLPRKVAAGELDDIRPCLGCMKCQDGLRAAAGGPTACAVNPHVGEEHVSDLRPSPHPKRVVVIGGGPAGMEAASTAALRGHQVILFEQAAELGGQLVPGARPPGKGDIALLNKYLAREVEKAGVEVRLGQAATTALVKAQQPDAVILASGTVRRSVDIPGLDSAGAVHAVDVLAGRAVVGERVAIIGGELVGCETAEMLATAGKRVTVLRRGAELATKVNPTARPPLLQRLSELGVRTVTGVRYEAVTAEGVVITGSEGGRELISADSIVLATGGASERSLAQALATLVPEFHLIGDCVEPRSILEAVADGWRVGLEV